MTTTHRDLADVATLKQRRQSPDFGNLASVFRRGRPPRPTMFEFFLSDEITDRLTSDIVYDPADPLLQQKKLVDTFRIAGYDFVTLSGSAFGFPSGRQEQTKASISLNADPVIYDRETYDKYQWPDPESFDYSVLDDIADYLPGGMKIVICDQNGVLEQAEELVGYENLCVMLFDDPDLVQEIFDHIGRRLLKYHQICAGYESVGAHFLGDDWGFASQTLLSPAHLRQYVLPWHKGMVEAVHGAGKFAILHSCGDMYTVIDDVIDDLRYDAKHSFEDKILPVEDAYDRFGQRIAILGGLDVDFLCRSTPEQIYDRAVGMLERTDSKGYALGSGNSIPYYVPFQNYLALISAGLAG